MSFLSVLAGIGGAIQKYLPAAVVAVGEAQQAVGLSAGDKTKQDTKKQLAVSLVLAGAHAGEMVPNSKVQEVAAVVEYAVGVASALGLFGKTQKSVADTIQVPGTLSKPVQKPVPAPQG